MIELLMAMVILNIGILAIVASFNAGIFTLNRASRITTASVLADQQMELFRAIEYGSIRLASATIRDRAVRPTRRTARRRSRLRAAAPVRTPANAPPRARRPEPTEALPGSTPTSSRRHQSTAVVKQVTIVVRDDADQGRVSSGRRPASTSPRAKGGASESR